MSETLLPLWQCHKKVRADKIVDIHGPYDDGGASLELVSANVRVDADYMRKHEPQIGGYYVRYEGGYESWSPAEAFEGGYTPMFQPGPAA